MKPLITVIIPVYNTEQYLDECLSSVEKQIYQELQIICVDDGSTDNSLRILKKWEERDKRFTVLQSPRGGVSRARNLGIIHAKGDYIAFVDSDDLLAPEYFSVLIDNINDSIDVSICNYENFYNTKDIDQISFGDGRTHYYSPDEAIRIRNIYTYIHGRIYRKSLFSHVLFNEKLRRSNDIFLNHQIFPLCNTLRYNNTTLYYRRIRNDSIIHSPNPYESLIVAQEFCLLAEETLTYANIRRANRALLSFCSKCDISHSTQLLNETIKLQKRILIMNALLPLYEKAEYGFLIKNPRLFALLYKMRRKHLNKTTATMNHLE